MSTSDAGLTDELVVELTPADPDPQQPVENEEPAEPEECD